MLNTYIRENKMRKGIMSLEDLEERVEPNPELGKELGEDRLGYQEAFGEAEALQDDVAEGSATIKTLDSIVEPLEASGEPLTDAGTKALDIALEHLCKRVGLSKRRTPAFESYAGKKPTATLESLKEIGKSIWDAILKAYAKIKEYAIKAYEFFFSARKKVESVAKEVKEEIKDVQKEHSPSDIKEAETKVEETLEEAKVSSADVVFSAADMVKINALEEELKTSIEKSASIEKTPSIKEPETRPYKNVSINNARLAKFFDNEKDVDQVIHDFSSLMSMSANVMLKIDNEADKLIDYVKNNKPFLSEDYYDLVKKLITIIEPLGLGKKHYVTKEDGVENFNLDLPFNHIFMIEKDGNSYTSALASKSSKKDFSDHIRLLWLAQGVAITNVIITEQVGATKSREKMVSRHNETSNVLEKLVKENNISQEQRDTIGYVRNALMLINECNSSLYRYIGQVEVRTLEWAKLSFTAWKTNFSFTNK